MGPPPAAPPADAAGARRSAPLPAAAPLGRAAAARCGGWVRGWAGREVGAGAAMARGEGGSGAAGSREEVAGCRGAEIWRRSGERRRAVPVAGRLSGLYVTAAEPGAAERLSPSRAARRASSRPRQRQTKSRSAPPSPRVPFPTAPSGAAPAGGVLRAPAPVAPFPIAPCVLPFLPLLSFPRAFASRSRSALRVCWQCAVLFLPSPRSEDPAPHDVCGVDFVPPLVFGRCRGWQRSPPPRPACTSPARPPRCLPTV